ncbi:hypothetical protein D5F11_009095 [Siminovitchia terrae]|uniref:Uncharacterized protein n=1 Tax=Siminovitchia terrae TaxID=1914933 RepID=A0A429XAV6_SIMTE|nr:hypothetical protein [Siminovitchia terrae]RST60203.1 hypothetical protein D5F11_009095 [Siminovitchia terrae]
MNKPIQKVASVVCASLLLTTTLFSSLPTIAKAASEPITDSITITLKMPDTVGEGYGREPTDFNTIYQMVQSGGKSHPQRTGWSGATFACNNSKAYDKDGNRLYNDDGSPVSPWVETGRYNTTDSHEGHSPSKFRNEIIEKYSKELGQERAEELYDLAVKSGKLLEYDPNSEIPARWINTPQNAHHGPTGRYVIHSEDTRTIDCTDGQTAYFYNNLDFFITMTFDVTWEDEENGTSTGEAYWELQRTNPNAPSELYAYSAFEVPYEKHVAVRNEEHTVTIASKHVRQKGPIQFHMNAQEAKGVSMKYGFGYEYTNKEIGWVCTGSGEEQTCEYDSSPDWRAAEEFNLAGSIPVDHKQGDTIRKDTIEDVVAEKFVVGRQDLWNDSSKTSKVFHEEWSKASSNTNKSRYELKTQSTLPILPGDLEYQVEVPSDAHKDAGYRVLRSVLTNGHYYPVDVDDSLKAEYANNTGEPGYDYAIPLQQSVMNDKGMSGNKRKFDWKYETDLFFTTKHTGFQTGYGYAADVKNSVVNNVSLPSHSSLMSQGRNLSEAAFANKVGEVYKDDILYTNQNEFDKLKRYMIPVDPDSPLEPMQEYKNHTILKNMGLSDLKVEFDQTFTFERFLFGSGADDVFYIEQVDTRQGIGSMENVHTILIPYEEVKELAQMKMNRTTTKMHKLRFADRDFTDKVKAVLELGL